MEESQFLNDHRMLFPDQRVNFIMTTEFSLITARLEESQVQSHVYCGTMTTEFYVPTQVQ